ncbi:Dolichol-phosphate mannosyltransferase subunit 3 [Penicillium ucsense]|uniref:Dolichol-phosphate mannosyltransferase subunit 3 n=1 Tax=Penicillium ucsense TaxID=2839758 RepID=A0A8J8WDJ2_9EURO|nr:Dolichol-phosphate mannosyltransferase subunit 3 [Penicillium ucsense]KAF7729795.1 Dolichol-phosphate mannosyltransferase subunit 3 [Penicillium ucsense]
MTRAQQTVSVLLLVSSFYLSLYLGLVPLNETVQTEIIPVLPFYAVIVFGCYLLGRLGLAIFTFNDVPEAHAELQKEIELAKVELRKGNVEVD